MTTNNATSFSFQAEMSQVLHLLTHSLYSKREVFLRELISNASDALGKLHFESLTNTTLLTKDEVLQIKLEIDKEQHRLTLTDNGIGMTKQELIDNIGTIAKSGTSKFLQQMTGNKESDIELIGRFGVGFYSVFMVTSEVVVTTKSWQDEQGYVWKSNGESGFTIEEVKDIPRGTSISFVLKEDAYEFIEDYRIEQIIQQYSNFVAFPILLNDKTLNKETAIWQKTPSETKKEEYLSFYKHLSHTEEEPFEWLHLKAEAPVQFSSILYIPLQNSRSLWQDQRETALQLYAKRVFIQSDCKDLLSPWLRFIQGIVDSEDIQLNVSREQVQQNDILLKINQYLTKRVIKLFTTWATKDVAKYEKFWKEFGNFIKEGLHTDYANKDKLVDLYRCSSSLYPDKLISFKEYAERMPEDQKEIYYIYGKSKESLAFSPNLEYFKENNIEVLYLYEEIDDFIMPSIGKYQDKAIVGIDKANLTLDNKKDKETEEEKTEQESNKLIQYFKDILGDRVGNVVVSKRLVSSPCTIVRSEENMTPQLEKMMKTMDPNFVAPKPVLEINLDNDLIQNLATIQKNSPQDPILKDSINQLFEGVCMQNGILEDPSEFLHRSIQFIEQTVSKHEKL